MILYIGLEGVFFLGNVNISKGRPPPQLYRGLIIKRYVDV